MKLGRMKVKDILEGGVNKLAESSAAITSCQAILVCGSIFLHEKHVIHLFPPNLKFDSLEGQTGMAEAQPVSLIIE